MRLAHPSICPVINRVQACVFAGVYTGFSQGGAYARRWTDKAGAKRYTADPHEISLVDLPCLAAARFEMIKADGSHEWRPFKDTATAERLPPNETPPDDLEKIGARNSAEDQARIQAMHDTAVDLGASCVAHKIHVVQSRDLAPDLAKQFDRLTDVLTKSLVDLSTRLKAVEEQPLPLPFAMQARAVAKHEDGIGEERLDALLADPNALSLLAIKLAQRQGR